MDKYDGRRYLSDDHIPLLPVADSGKQRKGSLTPAIRQPSPIARKCLPPGHKATTNPAITLRRVPSETSPSPAPSAADDEVRDVENGSPSSVNLKKTTVPPKAFKRHRSPFYFNLRHINIRIWRGPDYSVNYLVHFFAFAAAILASFLPVYLVQTKAYPFTQSRGNLGYGYDCTYAGKFTFEGIDMPFGTMSFAEAKALDLAWNTFVGRSLQTFFGWFAYQTFTNILMEICEKHHIEYELYAAIALATTRYEAFWPVCKSVFSKAGKSRWAMLWMLVTIIWLAFFPTFIDAVSGYQGKQKTHLKLGNSSTVDVTDGFWYVLNISPPAIARDVPPFSEFNNTMYNGTTISLTFSSDQYDHPYIYWGGRAVFVETTKSSDASDSDTTNSSNLGSYEWSLWCLNDTASGLYIDTPWSFGNDGMILWQTYNDTSCVNWWPLTWLSPDGPNATPYMTYTYLGDSSNYECVSDFGHYSWGFNFAFLLLTSAFTGIWVLITYLLWARTYFTSQLVQKRRKVGNFRLVLDLADAIRSEFGDNHGAYSEEEIVKMLRKRAKAGKGGEGKGVGYVVEKDGGKGASTARLRLKSGIEGKKLEVEWDREYG